MKKTKVTSFVMLFAFLINFTPTKGQVTYAKPEEFKILKKRPLIVEQLELDEKLITHYKKKIAKAKKPDTKKKWTTRLSNYKNFANDFNKYIRTTVEKNFDLNSEYIYKTTEEIKNIMKSKSKKYTILYYSESSNNQTDEYGKKYFPDLTIPTLNYTRSENGTVKVDYSFFMPYTGSRKENKIKEVDFKLSFLLMKQHILEIEKSGNKRYTFKKYAVAEKEKNYKELGKEKIMLNKDHIRKGSSITQINSNYSGGEVIAVSEEEYNAIILKGEDKIIGIVVAYSIATSATGAAIVSLKSFINAKTGKIYTTIGAKMGQFADPYFRNKQFTKYNNE